MIELEKIDRTVSHTGISGPELPAMEMINHLKRGLHSHDNSLNALLNYFNQQNFYVMEWPKAAPGDKNSGRAYVVKFYRDSPDILVQFSLEPLLDSADFDAESNQPCKWN